MPHAGSYVGYTAPPRQEAVATKPRGDLAAIGNVLALAFGLGGVTVATLLPGAIQELTGKPVPMPADALLCFQFGIATIGLLLGAVTKLLVAGLDSPHTVSRTLNITMAFGFSALVLGVLILANVI